MTEYRGYTIEQNDYVHIFYPTAEGYDAWVDGEGWRDNAGVANSIQDAKEQIDDILDEQKNDISREGDLR